ncbi:MAG: hypothetical protein HPY69_08375 [Armatimonadetes bacterium]|nr:hypothetical protein [Armatimonadota bacterium]
MRREKLVTAESQKARVDEILAVYRSQGVAVHCDLRRVPLHSLIATQDGIEADKLEVVRRLVQQGKLTIPVVVEEHFLNDRLTHYLLDGHCRVRSLIEAGKTSVEAYVLWSPAGTFRSNFIEVARQYGDVRVKDLPLV